MEVYFKKDRTYVRANPMDWVRLMKIYLISVFCMPIAVGLFLLFYKGYMSKLDLFSFLKVVQKLEIAIIGSFILPGAYLIYVARTIYRAGCYPYPGMLLVRDTIFHTGKSAKKHATRLMLLGVSAIVIAIISIVVTVVLFQRLKNEPGYRMFNRTVIVVMSR